jgi:hypothetical protein
MGAKSRVGPRVQIERSLKNGVLALVLHTAVLVIVRVIFPVDKVCLGAVELLLFFVSGDRRL